MVNSYSLLVFENIQSVTGNMSVEGHYFIYIYIYIYIYNSLKIHEENTKENHKRVGSIHVIKIHVPLYVKKKFNIFGLRKIIFQTFLAN